MVGLTSFKSLVADHYCHSGFGSGLNMAGGTFDKTLRVRGMDALEKRFAKVASDAMWGETLKVMLAFLDAGFGTKDTKAVPKELSKKLERCKNIVHLHAVPSMETPFPLSSHGCELFKSTVLTSQADNLNGLVEA